MLKSLVYLDPDIFKKMSTFWTLCDELKTSNGLDDDSIKKCVFFIIDFSPIYVWLGLFVLFLTTRDIYVYLISIGVTIDTTINYLLAYTIGQDGIGRHNEMPCLATQLIIFISTMCMLTYVIYHMTPSVYHLFLLFSFLTSVVFARIYLDYNYLSQLYAGALIGLANAIIQHAIMYYHIRPRMHEIEKSRIYIWFGFNNRVMSNVASAVHESYDPVR